MNTDISLRICPFRGFWGKTAESEIINWIIRLRRNISGDVQNWTPERKMNHMGGGAGIDTTAPRLYGELVHQSVHVGKPTEIIHSSSPPSTVGRSSWIDYTQKASMTCFWEFESWCIALLIHFSGLFFLYRSFLTSWSFKQAKCSFNSVDRLSLHTG